MCVGYKWVCMCGSSEIVLSWSAFVTLLRVNGVYIDEYCNIDFMYEQCNDYILASIIMNTLISWMNNVMTIFWHL